MWGAPQFLWMTDRYPSPLCSNNLQVGREDMVSRPWFPASPRHQAPCYFPLKDDRNQVKHRFSKQLCPGATLQASGKACIWAFSRKCHDHQHFTEQYVDQTCCLLELGWHMRFLCPRCWEDQAYMTFSSCTDVGDLVAAPMHYYWPLEIFMQVRWTETLITSRSPIAKRCYKTITTSFIMLETCCSFLYLCGEFILYHLLPPGSIQHHSALRPSLASLTLPTHCHRALSGSNKMPFHVSGLRCNNRTNFDSWRNVKGRKLNDKNWRWALRIVSVMQKDLFYAHPCIRHQAQDEFGEVMNQEKFSIRVLHPRSNLPHQ